MQSTIVPRCTIYSRTMACKEIDVFKRYMCPSVRPCAPNAINKWEHNSKRSRHTTSIQHAAHAWPRWGLEHADETFHLEPSHQQRGTISHYTWRCVRMQCYIVVSTSTYCPYKYSNGPSAYKLYISSTCLISVQTNHSHGLSKDSPWNPFRKQAASQRRPACLIRWTRIRSNSKDQSRGREI